LLVDRGDVVRAVAGGCSQHYCCCGFMWKLVVVGGGDLTVEGLLCLGDLCC